MEKYPTLAQLGIRNPHEIARFTVHTIDTTDFLRIVYNRQKGSLLPGTRKYRFPQIQKSVVVDSGTRKTQTMHESAPALARAIEELNSLVDEHRSNEQVRRIVEEELTHLEHEVDERIAYIRALLSRLK